MRRILCLVLISSVLVGGPRGRDEALADGSAAAHVVVVLFGGGVRLQDVRKSELCPTLAAWATDPKRVLVDRVESDVRDDYEGAARMLTGSVDAVRTVGDAPRVPTLLERVRVAEDLAPHQVWFCSHESGAALALAHSRDPAFGIAAAPSLASGRGAFGEPLAAFLEQFGHPGPLEALQERWLTRLRARNREANAGRLPEARVLAGTPTAERTERALLDELDARTLLARGPAVRDERALRAATTVLRIHRPRLLVVRLGDAAIARQSLRRYEEVLRRVDRGIAGLREAVAADPRLAGRTCLVVALDRGRNASPGAGGELAEDDASTARSRVGVFFEGPGLKRRARVRGPRRLVDLAPTLLALLGHPRAAGELGGGGRVWQGLLRK